MAKTIQQIEYFPRFSMVGMDFTSIFTDNEHQQLLALFPETTGSMLVRTSLVHVTWNELL